MSATVTYTTHSKTRLVFIRFLIGSLRVSTGLTIPFNKPTRRMMQKAPTLRKQYHKKIPPNFTSLLDPQSWLQFIACCVCNRAVGIIL